MDLKPPDKSVYNQKLIFLFLNQNVVGSQKNRLNEGLMVIWNGHNSFKYQNLRSVTGGGKAALKLFH